MAESLGKKKPKHYHPFHRNAATVPGWTAHCTSPPGSQDLRLVQIHEFPYVGTSPDCPVTDRRLSGMPAKAGQESSLSSSPEHPARPWQGPDRTRNSQPGSTVSIETPG